MCFHVKIRDVLGEGFDLDLAEIFDLVDHQGFHSTSVGTVLVADNGGCNAFAVPFSDYGGLVQC